MSKLSGTIYGLLMAVVAGVLVWLLTEGLLRPPPEVQPPIVQKSLLEKAAGDYTLKSWTPVVRQIELGAQVVEGTLHIDSLGTADWSVLVQQSHTQTPGKVRMTARGRIVVGSSQIVGVQGGSFNNDHYLDNIWGQISEDVQVAVRGWTYSGEDSFDIALDNGSEGRTILQMSNSRGMFTWTK